MRTKFIFILLAFALLFGCIADETFSGIKREAVVDTQKHDIDGDGIWDYAVYDFSPVKTGEKTTVQRMVAVSKIQHATYTSFNEVTDLNLLDADGKLDDFSREKKQDEELCARNIGLYGVKCADIYTCSKLCSATDKCRGITEKYDEVVGSGMISYGRETGTIDSLVVNTRNIVLELRHTDEERKNIYLSDLMEIKSKVALLNTNPLLFHPEIALCEQSGYGLGNLGEAASTIGTYQEETIGYEYTVVLHVESTDTDKLSRESIGAEITDYIPLTIDEDAVSSHQKITTESDGGVSVNWMATGMGDGEYMLYYHFQSETEPDALISELNAPQVRVTHLDLSFIGPFDSLFIFIHDISGNYYFAAGMTLGITVALLLFIYSLIVFFIQMMSYGFGGKKFGEAVKRAFGRIGIRWKIDFPLGAIAVASGFFVSSYMVSGPVAVASILDMLEPLLDPFGFSGFALAAIGVILLYDGAENLLKVTLVERYYGVAVREERSTYLANITDLRKKIKELKEMIDEYSGEEFDVGPEYAVLSSISLRQLDNYEKRMTASSARTVEDHLAKVDNAIESLQDRKAMADENWTAWKESIRKMLSEKNVVNAAMLSSIPSTLRTWALTRYAKEEGDDELVFEKDVLKRRKTTPTMLIKEMVKDGMLDGGIVLKDEKVAASYFEGKSATVNIALLYRLRGYLNSLGKALALGAPTSFVSVGNKNVFVVLKTSGYECGLFVQRDRFREAIEKWKIKIRTVSE